MKNYVCYYKKYIKILYDLICVHLRGNVLLMSLNIYLLPPISSHVFLYLFIYDKSYRPSTAKQDLVINHKFRMVSWAAQFQADSNLYQILRICWGS